MIFIYKDTILKIKNLEKLGLKPQLSRIKKLLDLMGNPQKNLKYIHIAGTNGKGSVCFMLANILKVSGYHTGLYTSPSINDFKERIQINNNLISQDEFEKLLNYVESFNNHFENDKLTEFEVFTAIAFKYFYEKKCDIVVLETGMGGMFDATNIIEHSLCSVITTISYDHINFLGNTISKIANEKLGIVKNNSKLILGPNLDDIVYSLAKEKCKICNSEIIISNIEEIKNFKLKNFKTSTFMYNNKIIEVRLIGNHQKYNISIVLTILNSLKTELNKVNDKSISEGLKTLIIPCRIEVIKENPLIILDASHNVESVTALCEFIDKNLVNKPDNKIAVFSLLKDKDIEGIFKVICNKFSKILLLKSDSNRSMSIKSMENYAKNYNDNDVISNQNFEEGLKNEILNLSKNSIMIIFGSFSIMKKAKKISDTVDTSKYI